MRFAVEIAEAAARDADVRGIDVAVYLPRYDIGVGDLLAPECVSLRRQFGQRRFVIEPAGFAERQRFAVASLGEYLFQRVHLPDFFLLRLVFGFSSMNSSSSSASSSASVKSSIRRRRSGTLYADAHRVAERERATRRVSVDLVMFLVEAVVVAVDGRAGRPCPR